MHLGVRGRNSNNDLVGEKLGWDYSQSLEEGIRKHIIGYVCNYTAHKTKMVTRTRTRNSR